MQIPEHNDLLWILAGVAALGALVAQAELVPGWLPGPLAWLAGVLRLLLGLVYVLYAPGYLLQALFFPIKDDLDTIERAGLSLGLSVALLSLLALLLDALPWGLRLWSIVLGQGGVVLILLAAVGLLRRFLPGVRADAPGPRPQPRRWWADLAKVERRLLLATVAALLFAALVVAWVILIPSDADFMTEFYILGTEGLAEDYPRQAVVGESLRVTAGIHNLERADHTYRIEVFVQEGWDETSRQLLTTAGPFDLKVGQTLEFGLEWEMPFAGEDLPVLLFLYLDDGKEPYRSLRLWLNVSPHP